MPPNDPPSSPVTASHGGIVETAAIQSSGVPRFALPAYFLLIVYVSLSPMSGWRRPENGVFYFLFAGWPKYVTIFDLAANFLAYVPLGVMLYESVRRVTGKSAAVVATTLICAALSFTMESLQALLPMRVSSIDDLISNSLGALDGAMFAALVGESALTRWLGHVRSSVFSGGVVAELGEVLLGVWLITQLNPSIPFLGAGNINNPLVAEWNAQYDEPLLLLPQGLAVALNVCGFGLFVSVLTRPGVHGFRWAMAFIGSGFFLKLLAAGVMLKPPLLFDWLGYDTAAGMFIGLTLLALLLRFSHRVRIYLAAMVIFAGGLLAKIAAIYDSLPEIVRVFSWPYGQLLNFSILTRWLHELWPLLALVYLILAFNRLPPSDSRAI
jgi:glycopeptide antibiotics resistance protein